MSLAGEENSSMRKAAPSDRLRTRLIVYSVMAVIALIGLADATFLTLAHLTGDDAVCGSLAGCTVVLGSRYASINGVPTAGFGALAYFTVFSLAILAAFGYARV